MKPTIRLFKFLIGLAMATWLYALPVTAQAEDYCICHDAGAKEGEPLTLCYASEAEVPPGHQAHLGEENPNEVQDEVGTCESLADDDGDGVNNGDDLCPDTPDGEEVDADGCSDSQKDDDGDGVNNNEDLCPGTPDGEEVDADGCSDSQKDDDGDGVNNNEDLCPGTPDGEEVDADGCSDSQKDDDGDGVNNNLDECPDTPEGVEVDGVGCPLDGDVFSDTGTCDESGPSDICSDAQKAVLKVKSFKKVIWKWLGDAGDMSQFSSPLTDAYNFCVYVNGILVRNTLIPAGAFDKAIKAGWKTKLAKDASLKKHKYKSGTAGPDGMKKTLVKNSGNPGKDKVAAKSLNPPEVAALDTESPTDEIVVQVVDATSGNCVTSTHAEPFDKSTGKVLKDKVINEVME